MVFGMYKSKGKMLALIGVLESGTRFELLPIITTLVGKNSGEPQSIGMKICSSERDSYLDIQTLIMDHLSLKYQGSFVKDNALPYLYDNAFKRVPIDTESVETTSRNMSTVPAASYPTCNLNWSVPGWSEDDPTDLHARLEELVKVFRGAKVSSARHFMLTLKTICTNPMSYREALEALTDMNGKPKRKKRRVKL